MSDPFKYRKDEIDIFDKFTDASVEGELYSIFINVDLYDPSRPSETLVKLPMDSSMRFVPIVDMNDARFVFPIFSSPKTLENMVNYTYEIVARSKYKDYTQKILDAIIQKNPEMEAYISTYHSRLNQILPSSSDLVQPSVYQEPVYQEPVQTESVQTESVETEFVETEPVETESVETEPVQTEPVQTEPVQTEYVEMEPSYQDPVLRSLAEKKKKRRFQIRYVYNLSDLENMNESMTQHFAKILDLPYDQSAKKSIISILDQDGLVLRPDQPISRYRNHISTLVSSEKGLDFAGVFPEEGFFYLAKLGYEDYQKMIKFYDDRHAYSKSPALYPNFIKQFKNKLATPWKDLNRDIIRKKLDKTQDAIKYASNLASTGLVKSAKTLARIVNVPPTKGLFRETMPERQLQVFLNQNTIVIVPVNNQLAGVPYIVGEEETLDFYRTEFPKVYAEKLNIRETKQRILEIHLPASDLYLFCFPGTLKRYFYDGPDQPFKNFATYHSNKYLYPYFQRMVQLAVDSVWDIDQLDKEITEDIRKKYQKFKTSSGPKFQYEFGSLISIYLPCLASADCWKSSVEYLLKQIKKLPRDELKIVPTSEVSSVFATCTAAWSSLPYDQRRDWCERIARIYRILLQIPFNQETEPYFTVIRTKTRFLSAIGVNNWLKQENSERIEQAIQDMEARINNLVQLTQTSENPNE